MMKIAYLIDPITSLNPKKDSSVMLMEEAIKNGISFLISPEGTRTLNGEIGSFKKGPFHLAKNTNATIVPIALKGGFKAKKKSDWRVQPGILTVVFGEPIESSQFSTLSVKELGELVRNKILELKQGSL